jgi:hypothetical protein
MVIRNIFQRLDTKFLLCLVMVMAADWMFYDQPLGFATLTADELTMLDHATHLSDVNLQWQTVQENYLLLLPAAPVVLSAGSDMIFGTAGAHASHAKQSIIAPPFFYQVLGHDFSYPSPLASNNNIPLSSSDTVYCNRRCA